MLPACKGASPWAPLVVALRRVLSSENPRRTSKPVTKRKFITEDVDDERYPDAECPECGAVINAHFQRGRNWRRLQCPICHRHVTISIEKQEEPLIQLGRAGAE